MKKERERRKVAKEFILGISNYSYGLYHNERDSKYYISDTTIETAVTEIGWSLSNLEKKYIANWIELERIHRKYCLNIINDDEYDNKITNNYKQYYTDTGFEFGENCERIEAFLYSYFE